MDDIQLSIISKSSELPQMECKNFFHSIELFKIAERASRHTPYMVIAHNKANEVVAHILALVRWHRSWLPPYLYRQGRIYGEGEYTENCTNKEEVFGMMLQQITSIFKRKLALYVEFSDLNQKMFGYKHFRYNKYFPIRWQEIHNSLDDTLPELRLSTKTIKQIAYAEKLGVMTREIQSKEELHEFYKHLKSHFRSKIRRFIPTEELFAELYQNQHTKIFITLYKNKLIGGCTCVYSKGNAYLWYLASKRKTYYHLHPDTITVWNAIQYAHSNKCNNFYFLDAGLPLKKSRFRDFILCFGGTPVTKYRWFRFSIPWINRFLSWLYRE